MRNVEADAISVQHDIRERSDRLQIALNKTFGVTHETRLAVGATGLNRIVQGAAFPESIPAFSGIREAYVTMQGDPDLLYVGKRRILQSGTPDFPSAMANVMSNLLLRDFNVEYRWRDIVSEFTSPSDFRPQQRGRMGFIEDLPDVGEDEPYDELVSNGDEGYQLTVNQKGGTLTVTRRAILADDVGAVQRLVAQAGRAAWRTLAKRVWNLVISNAVYGADGLPVFHTDHGNLGSTALSIAGLDAGRLAIFNQCEPGSTQRMGLGRKLFLAVPIELESKARQLGLCELDPSDVTKANPWKFRLGPNCEQVFANPLFDDQDDYYLFDTSGDVGLVEVGFLHGQQSPQIIVSNSATSGQTFSQDRYTWKLRHEYEVAVADFRGMWKSVVAA